MADRLFVITAQEVEDTGRVSFKFMFDSGMPRDWPLTTPWGWLTLEPKDDDYFDPWAWSRGEPCVGDFDGVPRWSIYLFESGKGQIFTASGDDSKDNTVLKEIVKDMPEAVILVHHALFERLEKACAESGVEVVAHHFDGRLKTC